MATRLGSYVVYGELWNTHRYSTHGTIVLRGPETGQETLLRFELAGDCDPDLRGKCIRFRPGPADAETDIFRQSDFPKFQLSQIGPTGTMTAEGWVRVLSCPVIEFIRRSELGEPPPTTWGRHLYLEWYGQNGRIVIEMGGVEVEECIRQPRGEDDEGAWRPLPHRTPKPGTYDPATATGPEITVFRQEEDGTHIETWAPAEAGPPMEDGAEHTASLDRQLESEAAAIDRAIRGESEMFGDPDADHEATREMELIDYCIDHAQDQPIASLVDGSVSLPSSETLSDEAVEAALKDLLARLALLGIALDVCEHFTPRACYDLLRNRILTKERAYTELIGTGWVQHMATSDYCADCEADCEAPNNTPETAP